jgi:polysaccharide export outer membrane protein
MDGPTIPIVYSANFSDPAGYFLATRVQMHNKDVIFAANTQAVEITKFAAFANTIMSVPANGIGLASAIQANRIIFHTPNPTGTTTAIITSPAPVTTP